MFAATVLVVEVFVNAGMANLVGGDDDFVDIVGDAIDFAVCLIDGFGGLHLLREEAVEWLPEGFADEKHWHARHFLFLHQKEDFGKFVECAEATREEHVDF